MTDYSNMSLREELEARFREQAQKENEEAYLAQRYPEGKDRWMEIPEGEPLELNGNFDGEYFAFDNGNRDLWRYPARAGGDLYQRVSATDMPNRGPIPEGKWLIKYEDLETNDEPMTYANHKRLSSWGRQRVRLRHVSGEDYGRDNFYLHGSYNGLGSAGCIDVGLQMPYIARILKKYKRDIPLIVKYNKKFYE